MRRRRPYAGVTLVALLAFGDGGGAQTPPPAPPHDTVVLAGGEFTPFLSTPGDDEARSVTVGQFRIDAVPVTRSQFAAFVARDPAWHPDNVPRVFADAHYLARWDGAAPPEPADAPVANVSWFAARAYCDALGGRLPTMAEWEWAADVVNADEATTEAILRFYGAPRRDPVAVRQGQPNPHGLYDMLGVHWEWVEDFDAALSPEDGRGGGDSTAFCGAGSLGARDPSDYASFMRFAFRSSLSANFTIANLGFRCAYDT